MNSGGIKYNCSVHGCIHAARSVLSILGIGTLSIKLVMK